MPISSSVYRESPFAVASVPGPPSATTQLVWGHGWGQSADALLPIAESLRVVAPSLLIDFPGFGKSPIASDTWGTAEYADQVAGWLRTLPGQRTVWVGHSFGGRVGLQLAARHPGLLSGMVLVAAAGLQRQRSLPERMRLSARTTFFKTARKLLHEGPVLDQLRQKMGSADYLSAGALRPILSRVVREDLTEQARQVQCPTLLLYGAQDTETPPEIGERLSRLIPHARFLQLADVGHLTILTDGRHQVAARIKEFLQTIPA